LSPLSTARMSLTGSPTTSARPDRRCSPHPVRCAKIPRLVRCANIPDLTGILERMRGGQGSVGLTPAACATAGSRAYAHTR